MLLLLLLGGSLASAAFAAEGDTELISRQSESAGPAGGDEDSENPSASAGGRFVAFESEADNLTGVENEAVTDVFVRDSLTDTTTLVSRRSAANGGEGGDAESSDPSISADGRYVAFESRADNLSGADGNSTNDVYVRDTQANTTALVSRRSAANGGEAADTLFTSSPSISADGRYVSFTSSADNLTGGDENGTDDVFLRDTQANTTTLVSRRSQASGGEGGDSDSFSSSISADGRYVGFASVADNLSGADNDMAQDVFLRDTQANTTSLVSRRSQSSGGQAGDNDSFSPSTSANGRYVAFASGASNLSGADEDGAFDVFVRDTQAETTTFVSRRSQSSGGQGGDGNSVGASISGNGRFVAFASVADNLSGGDEDGVSDVFVRDTQAETTTFVSRRSQSSGGQGGDGNSVGASISGNGRFVAFASDAENVSGADMPGTSRDVFRRDVLGP